MKKHTILNVTYVDGKSEVMEYAGDDLVGINQMIDKAKKKKEVINVQVRTVDDQGKVYFDQSFNYAPAEATGEVISEL
jgi:hypothetical protein